VDFTRQLRPGTYDGCLIRNEVRQLTEFSEDRKELEDAIKATESGFGSFSTKLFTTLEQLKTVEGRRAVVLFSEGVDMRSIEATAEGTARMAEEVGAVIYVVRFDTRWWIEADARRQEAEHPKRKIPFDIDGRIPLPPDFGGPDPLPTGIPKPNAPRIEIGQRPQPPVVYDPDGTGTRTHRMPNAEPSDQITSTLDKLYGEADSYLRTISTRTGGRVYNATTFGGTLAAFTAIAEELRNQYVIGYYSASNKADGKYHKIKLELSRKDLEVRARPGYRGSGQPR
jgi:VWFA-related protein